MNSAFSVITHHIANNGEKLPIIIETGTGLPLRIALRWGLHKRRGRSGWKQLTLENRLRKLSKLFAWANEQGIDLQEHLLKGEVLTDKQLRALVQHVESLVRKNDGEGSTIIEAGVFNEYMWTFKDFLGWAYSSDARGTPLSKTHDDVAAAKDRLETILEARRQSRGAYVAPLTELEIKAIRSAIGPHKNGIFYPSEDAEFPKVFSKSSRFRNWLLFEIAYGAGLRKGEILKLNVKDVALRTPALKVLRRADDINDPRVNKTPSVKTKERIVNIPDWLSRCLHSYIDNPPPLGRASDNAHSSYLFLAESGRPLAVDTINGIVSKIATYAIPVYEKMARETGNDTPYTLDNLTWHRFRHTWADEKFPQFVKSDNEGAFDDFGVELFMEAGGWNSRDGVKTYIKEAVRRLASEKLTEINENLYGEINVHSR